ncbi:polysaccharide pyruvyl transferase family protein [Luteolibacter luteus]|uniref:Polysaccharide pyruvyl transferase family protein n=1 Tax=Luteolibacter luteus TaxID=2728835 RepID=A0A858RDC2_9BACT|nr:polysaccharide pyruvyl transferase family protein [Luteolibacter luteus]QJE94588.1 polysaccharide pyruvyl transferase family protein [Luteolibacter luteus]
MKQPLTIEIHGTGTHNRGAELMAIAIAERLRAKYPGVRIVVPPGFGDFEARARHGFWTTWEFSRRWQSRFAAKWIQRYSKDIEEASGIVDPSEIDVVLDASGFSFSDKWGPKGARHLLKRMTRGGRAGKPLVLLPQAFGPFTQPEVADATRKLCQRASLVCARDARSREEVLKLATLPTLRVYPDFTVGIKPQRPANLRIPEQFSAVVPNQRMVDKGQSGEAYLGFIGAAVHSLKRRGLNPVFLLHDANDDRKVVSAMRERGIDIPVLEHEDARVLKAILGKATLVIGSRFHALVSTLSQGLPAIAAGWSHKYPELYADFGCPEFLIGDLADDALLEAAIDRLATPEGRASYKQRLQEAATRIKAQNEAMWTEVEAVIHASQTR